MCIFCKIINGEIPSTKVYEDDFCVAFMDIGPVNKGHVLVVPKKHAETFLDLTEEEAGELFKRVNRIAKAVKKGLNADGLNIINNVGEASGQEVFHVHVHIIPRFYDDGMNFGWRKLQYVGAEIEDYANLIKSSLEK
nr:HIT family protein [Thermosulfidibacter takaii]